MCVHEGTGIVRKITKFVYLNLGRPPVASGNVQTDRPYASIVMSTLAHPSTPDCAPTTLLAPLSPP